MKKTICIVAASSGKNLELAQSFKSHLEELGHQANLLDLVELDLPLYSAKKELTAKPEDVVAPFKDQINADAFIFVAPEYNGATPPTFGNFLAWTSRSTKNWRDAFNNKTALIATASGGAGSHVLISMRTQLAFIGMNVMGRSVSSSFGKPYVHDDLAPVINDFIKLIP